MNDGGKGGEVYLGWHLLPHQLKAGARAAPAAQRICVVNVGVGRQG